MHINSAKSLTAADMGGTSDPYVTAGLFEGPRKKVPADGSLPPDAELQQQQKTEIVHKTLEPDCRH